MRVVHADLDAQSLDFWVPGTNHAFALEPHARHVAMISVEMELGSAMSMVLVSKGLAQESLQTSRDELSMIDVFQQILQFPNICENY